jgi:hypothetical protein
MLLPYISETRCNRFSVICKLFLIVVPIHLLIMLAGAAQDADIVMCLALCRIFYGVAVYSFGCVFFSMYPVLEILQHFCRPGVIFFYLDTNMICWLFTYCTYTVNLFPRLFDLTYGSIIHFFQFITCEICEHLFLKR